MTKQDESVKPKREGRLAGMPFDWRRPTVARAKSRLWNEQDARFFTPKSFGWGYDVNFYWLTHPAGYVKARRGS
jgi:uncharacterized protein DUF5808